MNKYILKFKIEQNKLTMVLSYCCKQIKDTCKGSVHHHACNKIRNTFPVQGKILNAYLGVKKFRRNIIYKVCSNLYYKIPPLIEVPTVKNKKRKHCDVERLHHTRNQSVIRINQSKIKVIRLKVPGTSSEIFSDIQFNDVPEESNKCTSPKSVSLDPLGETFLEETNSRSNRDRFKANLFAIMKDRFRKTYNDVSIRVRRDRAKALGDDIIAMCFEKEKSLSCFEEYLSNDTDLAVNINMVMDDCRDYICVKLCRKLSDVPNNIPSSPPTEPDNMRSFNEMSKKEGLSLALTFLGSCTKNKYDELRNAVCNTMGLSVTLIPSYYLLTKNRPNVVGEIVRPTKNLFTELLPELTRPVLTQEERFELLEKNMGMTMRKKI